jgi:hypothetical protein
VVGGTVVVVVGGGVVAVVVVVVREMMVVVVVVGRGGRVVVVDWRDGTVVPGAAPAASVTAASPASPRLNPTTATAMMRRSRDLTFPCPLADRIGVD